MGPSNCMRRVSLIFLLSCLIYSEDFFVNSQRTRSTFILYRQNGTSPDGQVIRSISDVGGRLNGTTVIYIHDSTESPYTTEVRELVTSLLTARGVEAVFVVNWNGEPNDLFRTSYLVDDIGSIVGDFLYELILQNLVDVEDLHCIGFGLGSHMCGIVGKELQQYDGMTIPRITALNPYHPFLSSNKRLAASDAGFVDVIHTCFAGLSLPIGDVDFYPNAGQLVQPGCGLSVDTIRCSCKRALDYFISSVLDICEFISRPCRNFLELLNPDLFCGSSRNNYGRMGWESRNATGRRIQYVRTTSTRPFC